jgi:hypothetical protein
MRALWAVDHVVKFRSMCFTGPHAEFYGVLTLECRPSRRHRVEISDATRVRGYGLSLNLGGGPDNEIKIQFILDILANLNIFQHPLSNVTHLGKRSKVYIVVSSIRTTGCTGSLQRL